MSSISVSISRGKESTHSWTSNGSCSTRLNTAHTKKCPKDSDCSRSSTPMAEWAVHTVPAMFTIPIRVPISHSRSCSTHHDRLAAAKVVAVDGTLDSLRVGGPRGVVACNQKKLNPKENIHIGLWIQNINHNDGKYKIFEHSHVLTAMFFSTKGFKSESNRSLFCSLFRMQAKLGLRNPAMSWNRHLGACG